MVFEAKYFVAVDAKDRNSDGVCNELAGRADDHCDQFETWRHVRGDRLGEGDGLCIVRMALLGSMDHHSFRYDDVTEHLEREICFQVEDGAFADPTLVRARPDVQVIVKGRVEGYGLQFGCDLVSVFVSVHGRYPHLVRLFGHQHLLKETQNLVNKNIVSIM